MRKFDIIVVLFAVFEFRSQNRDLMAFFSEFFRKAVASRGRSVVQFIRAFKDKNDLHNWAGIL